METTAFPNFIVELRLQGKYAHFRKFYSNASSLTFLVPPRTSICGLLASILQMERDSYYELFTSRNVFIALSIEPGLKLRRIFQTLNYVSETVSCVNDVSVHKQCRFELLTGDGAQPVSYRIWLGVAQNKTLESLIEKIRKHDLGFGIYLGQRQFLADLKLVREFSRSEFEHLPVGGYLDSAIAREYAEPDLKPEQHIMLEKLPLEQMLVSDKNARYRKNVRIADVIFETSGQRVQGRFQNCVKLHDTAESIIAFL